jgi:hypothetical protein
VLTKVLCVWCTGSVCAHTRGVEGRRGAVWQQRLSYLIGRQLGVLGKVFGPFCDQRMAVACLVVSTLYAPLHTCVTRVSYTDANQLWPCEQLQLAQRFEQTLTRSPTHYFSIAVHATTAPVTWCACLVCAAAWCFGWCLGIRVCVWLCVACGAW